MGSSSPRPSAPASRICKTGWRSPSEHPVKPRAEAEHAYPGRDHRRRPGRPAAVPPAGRGRRSTRWWSRPAAASTSQRGSGPASWSSFNGRRCWLRAAWRDGCGSRDSSTAASTCSGPGSGTTSTSSTWSAAACGCTARPRCTRTWSRPGTRPGSSSSTRSATPRCTILTRPPVRDLRRHRRRNGLDAEVVVGCDGSFGPSRTAVPDAVSGGPGSGPTRTPGSGSSPTSRPSTDELIYAWHPDGFALHSMRSATVSAGSTCRCPTDTDSPPGPTTGSGTALARRLGHGQDGWKLHPGRSPRSSVLPMRSYVHDADAARPAVPGRRRRAHRAAHRGQGAQPGGRRRGPARAGAGRLLRKDDPRPADALLRDRALRRVWRCTHFSWWMTTMLHTQRRRLSTLSSRLSQLRWVSSSPAGSAGLAENYAGLPISY